MTDKEMLEYAAKAAGIHIGPDSPWSGYSDHDGFYTLNMDGYAVTWRWNPLTDDGDALRLAVKLRINVEHAETLGRKPHGVNCWPVGRGDCRYMETDLSDPLAATRRAIVRAAAEVGRKL